MVETTETEVNGSSSFAVTDVLSKSGSSGKCRTTSLALEKVWLPVLVSILKDVSSSTLSVGCREVPEMVVCVVKKNGILATSTIRDKCLVSVGYVSHISSVLNCT